MFEAIGFVTVWCIGVLFLADIGSLVCYFIGFCKKGEYR